MPKFRTKVHIIAEVETANDLPYQAQNEAAEEIERILIEHSVGNLKLDKLEVRSAVCKRVKE